MAAICAFFLLALGVLSTHVFAQNDYRNLILSDNSNAHYLSPYLTHHIETDGITSAEDILNKPFLQSEVISNNSSLVLLSYKEENTWLSFGLNNRSSETQWQIDFGKGLEGRFGFLKSSDIYVYAEEEQTLYQYSMVNGNSPILSLPQNQKLQIILNIKNSKALPLVLPLKMVSQDMAALNADKTLVSHQILYVFLLGMAFFFIAIFVLDMAVRNILFSTYYLVLFGLLYIQNNWLQMSFMPTGIDAHIYIFFIVSTLSLLIANTQWKGINNKLVVLKLSFLIPFTIASIIMIIGHFVGQGAAFLTFFLTFTPSLFILIFIPLYSLMESQNKDSNSTAFILGWLIFLFGVCISTLSLSGIIHPVPAAINAYWFTLLPQAFFFAIHTRQNFLENYISDDQSLVFSRTLEINENDTVTKLRHSKEQAEHQRLLKVIEQERRTLNELRKSEARQTEEMRKAKEQADDANKGKSNFLAVVSHEIRTPMTGVMGMVRMLLNSNLTKEQTEYAQTIQDSSDAMLALLNDILDYEKIEQGKMSFEEIDFDLHRLLKGVTTLMQGHARQKDITLETVIGDDLPQHVMADPTRLRQVLLNLTGNAIKFTEKGKVTITAEFMGSDDSNQAYEIYFNVPDQGIGISEEAQKNLFTPFSQADNSISRKFGGTGLGLAISKGLVSAMGSEIRVNSKEGEGSTFFFTVKMKAAGNKDSKEAKQAQAAQKLTSKEIKNILIVDDNHINQQVVENFLKDHDYNIATADSAEKALEHIKEFPTDFIFMDIELPKMNGDEATKLIRQDANKAIRNIAVVALTGHIGNEYISKYLEAGIDSFIAKPIDPDKLVQAIKDAEKGLFNRKEEKLPKISQDVPSGNIPKEKEAPLSEIKVDHLELDTDPTPSAPDPEPEPVKGTMVIKNEESISAFNQPIDIVKSKPMTEVKPADISPPLAVKSNTTTSTAPSDSILETESLNNLKQHLDPAQLKEMLNDVLVKSDEIIDQIQKLMDKGNVAGVTRQCHDLKGMTGNFGLKELSLLAHDIESKSKSQPPIILAGLVSQLPDTKKRAQNALSKWLEA